MPGFSCTFLTKQFDLKSLSSGEFGRNAILRGEWATAPAGSLPAAENFEASAYLNNQFHINKSEIQTERWKIPLTPLPDALGKNTKV
ncbi:MAG: hypothetical protein Kow0042_13000 [Calditrichia bacterium]